MTKKYWILLALAVVLGALSLYLNTDWFSKDDIQIYHREQPSRMSRFSRKPRPGVKPPTPVFFGWDRKLKLDDVQVVPLAELQTNKHAHPLWHLVSDSNSVPTKGFVYGLPVPGMRPYVKNATADPLQPGVKYRLLLDAGAFKAQHDFTLTPTRQ